MKVKYFATLRRITGVQEENINAKNIRELLDIVIKKYGKEFYDSLYDQKGFKKGVIILKNGKNILYIKDLDTELNDGDVVSLFPPVAGG